MGDCICYMSTNEVNSSIINSVSPKDHIINSQIPLLTKTEVRLAPLLLSILSGRYIVTVGQKILRTNSQKWGADIVQRRSRGKIEKGTSRFMFLFVQAHFLCGITGMIPMIPLIPRRNEINELTVNMSNNKTAPKNEYSCVIKHLIINPVLTQVQHVILRPNWCNLLQAAGDENGACDFACNRSNLLCYS